MDSPKYSSTGNEMPQPFMFRSPASVYRGVNGPCDTSGEFMRTQLQEVRYAIQLWTFAVAGAGADGLIAAGTQRRSFSEGIGDNGVNLGWGGTIALSQQQTNAFPNGSLNNARSGAFVGRSLGFGVSRPFVFDSATGERTYSPTTDAYGARAARALIETIEYSLLQRDNNVSLNVGPPQLWPGVHQVAESNTAAIATLDAPNGAAIMLPLRREYVFIDDNQGSQNFLVGLANTQIRLVSDPADPLPAGFSVPVWTAVYGDVASIDQACDIIGGGGKSRADQARELLSAGFTPSQIVEMMR